VDVHGQLRGTMDGGDSLVSGGHQVLRTAGATQHAKRLQRIPVWANDDAKVQALLLRVFPKWRTDEIQCGRAARWAFIITHYFRMGETSTAIADALKLTPVEIRILINRITRTAAGLSSRTGKPRSMRGRPKKIA
jgi:hypothetical protein